MRFPLSWLKDWVELPEDLGLTQALLMKAGIGLEAVENPGEALRLVVVVKVLETAPHPNADRLRVCKVNDGTRDYRIVCGAKNFEVGAVVALAKDGAVLPGDVKIKKSKVRGEESEGMLCSPQELGLKPEVDGLLLLDAQIPLGTALATALGLDDVVLTLETTANRPDHLSLRGLARELAALGGLALKPRPQSSLKAGSPAALSVAIEDPAACSYYAVRVVEGLRVAPSPTWMQARLEKSGIRPISNLVDVTNYVLLEYGQPLHAFDADRLSGGRLEARWARPGEQIKTLDGQDRLLSAEDVVIADAAGPQALAGLMGGSLSEVTASTTRVVLEAAVFPAKPIRRTSRRLGLKSESSLRFERGVDPQGLTEALDRAAELLLELGQGSGVSPLSFAGGPGAAPEAVAFDPLRVNALLGTEIPPQEMAGLLRRRYFTVDAHGASWSATPPPWRRDLRSSVDLAEEVLQMAGVESLPSSNLARVRTPDMDDPHWTNAWQLRGLLAGLGLQEAQSLSFLHPELGTSWGLQGSAPRLDNPFSEDQALLRPSLLPNLTQAALGSLRRRGGGVAQFELGRAFKRSPKGVEENERIAILLAGERVPTSWSGPAQVWDYYDLKGLAEGLAEKLNVTFRCAGAKTEDLPAWAHPGQFAKISLGGLQGWMGALHPALLSILDAPKGLGQVLVLELEPNSPGKPFAKEPRYEAFSRVPAVERDLSCLMDSSMEAGKILDFLRNEGGLGRARVLDRFEGQPLPEGKKSLTFRLLYIAQGRSLTDVEVNQMHADLVGRLSTNLGVEVRQ